MITFRPGISVVLGLERRGGVGGGGVGGDSCQVETIPQTYTDVYRRERSWTTTAATATTSATTTKNNNDSGSGNDNNQTLL